MLIMFLNLGLMFNFHSKAQFVKKKGYVVIDSIKNVSLLHH